MASNVIYSAREILKEYHLNRVTISVLKGLDIEIHRGEIIAIVGISGVGKSTLLNILGLLDSPTSGTLTYSGRESKFNGLDLTQRSLRERAEIRNREFGFVFQFYHLLPDLSVIENVMLPAMIRYRSGDYRGRKAALKNQARELLDRVGLAERMEFSPTQLSGGERQRAAIARALMNNPQIVFFDEPTGNLDTATGERIHSLLLELNRSAGVAFVFVTHDESLANLAHRRLFMSDGLFVNAEQPS